MATQFDAVPDVQFDAVPEQPEFDAVPDEVVYREAERATQGAVQALGVMAAPGALDWSDVNEQLDAERFREAEGARATGDTGRAAQLIAQISPLTRTGQYLAGQQAGAAEGARQIAETAERSSTPSDVLSTVLGSGLSSTVQPIVESAGRNAGAAAGGALGAAAFIPGPPAAASRLSGIAASLFPISGAVMGSVAGGLGQEALLSAAETPEETQARQERAADADARNPWAARLGAMGASLPFFRPGLAQFGRAAAGDRGARLNLGIAGTIGGAMEVASAMTQGRPVEAADIAAGVFSNLIMNEPTRLGRRLGLQPSTEQAAAEQAAKYETPQRRPLGEAPSDLATDVMPAETDVFAGVQRRTEAEADQRWLREGFDAVPEAPTAETPSIPIRSSEVAPVADLPPLQSPVRENKAQTSLVLPNGDVVVGGRFHGETFEYAEALGAATYDDLVRGVSSFTTPDGRTWNLQGVDVPVTGKRIDLAELQARGKQPVVESEAAPELTQPAPPETSAEPTVPPAAETPVVPPAEPPPPAAAPEAVPQDGNATALKNEQVDAERVQRGLPPMEDAVPVGDKELWQRAADIEATDPQVAERLVAELVQSPRSISSEETMLLLRNRVRLQSEYRQANLDIIAARESGDTLALERAQKAKLDASDALTQNEIATGKGGAGTEQGRAFRLRRLFAKEDMSAPNLIAEEQAKRGERLEPEEIAEIEKIADDFQKAEADAEVKIAQGEAAAVEKQVDATITEIAKTPDTEPAVRSLADRIIAKLDKQAEAARNRLRERFKALGSAPDPLILADFTIMAATRIAKTSIKAGQWFAEMVKEFGEGVRPYLQSAWEGADKKLDEMVNAGTGDKKKRAATKAKILDAGVQQDRVSAAIAARVKEGESLDSLGNYIDKLVDSFVRGGVRDRNSLVAAVKGVLEPLSPGITDRKVGELISGYGRATLLSKDPLKVIKRDLKGQLQQVSKLEALAAKEPLAKTGPERRTPSDEERRLIREVNEAKKAAGVVVTDPATQLKSTMDSARTRIGNEIKDLTFEIETGTRPPERTPVQYEQDIEIMRGIRDRLRQTMRDLEGPREVTEEQRIVLTQRALNESIAALEARIAGQQPTARRAAPDTPAIRALKAKRDALREQLNEINAADSLLRENRKAESLVRSIERAEAELAGRAARPEAQQGPESQLVAEAREQLAAVREQIQAKRDADPAVQQARMDAAEAAVERAIKKLDEQLAAGDIAVQRSPSPAGSQRLEDLRMQRDAMNRLRAQLRAEARPKPNPLDVAIKARKAQLARQEADYEARIANEQFAPRTRKPPVDISGDAAAMDALARVQAVKDRFAKLQKEWELKNRTRSEKIVDGIKQAWDAIRNLKLSMDISAPIQTGKAMLSHPIQAGIAVRKGVRAFAEQLLRNSDAYAKRVEQRIVNSPNNKNGVYKEMKLDLSEVTGTNREENAGSVLERLADLESKWQDIPDFAKGLIGMKGKQLVKGAKGIALALPKLLGMGIKASNASFGAIANHMRATTADAIVARHTRRHGAPSKQQLELYGNEVNSATGKGGLRGEEGIRALLFAPNYYLSILKQLSLQPIRKALRKHEWVAAREIFEEYVRAAITATSVGMLVYLFGNRDKQTIDPRSANFARAMTDKGTSIDVTLGRGAYVTLASQLVTGEKVNKKGRVEKQDEMSALLSFIKGRLSRELSTALTTGKGKNFFGKEIPPETLAKELVAPLAWQDIDKVLKREGLTRGSFIQMLNLLGVTYRVAE